MNKPTYRRFGASLYQTPEWAAARLQAKRRDGWRCVKCGSAGRIEVDHVRPLRTHPDLALDLSNLQSLCARCHGEKTAAEIGLNPPISPDREAWKALVMSPVPEKEN